MKKLNLFLMGSSILLGATSYAQPQAPANELEKRIEINDRYTVVISVLTPDKDNQILIPFTSEYKNIDSNTAADVAAAAQELRASYNRNCQYTKESNPDDPSFRYNVGGEVTSVGGFMPLKSKECIEPKKEVKAYTEHIAQRNKTVSKTRYTVWLSGGLKATVKTTLGTYHAIKIISKGTLTPVGTSASLKGYRSSLDAVKHLNQGATAAIHTSLEGPYFISYGSASVDVSVTVSTILLTTEGFSGDYEEIEGDGQREVEFMSEQKIRDYEKKYGKKLAFVGCGIPSIKWGNNNGQGPASSNACIALIRD